MEKEFSTLSSNLDNKKEQSNLSIIKKLYKMLDKFQELTFDVEHSIYSKICTFLKKEFNDKFPPLDSEFFYEETAFALMEMNNMCILEGWEGLNYGPIFSARDKNEKLISNPDIKNISPKMIDYWEKRSDEVNNPILQCRYSGLVWDFSKKIKKQNPHIKHAQRFIDSSIEMAQLDSKSSFFQQKLKKALDISVSINDSKRMSLIKNAIIHYENTHSEDDKTGTWGYSFDWLIGDKDLSKKIKLTKIEKEKIIMNLEEKLKTLSDLQSSLFNPHHVEYIVHKLAYYYKNKSNREDMKRVLLVYRDAFLSASLPVLAGGSLLRKMRQVLFQYGLTAEAKQMESTIRDIESQSLAEFKKYEVRIPIPQKRINNYLNNLDNKTLSEVLWFIAVYNIPNEQIIKETVLKISKEQPLSFLIPHQIIDHTGRTVAEIGPIEEDLEGHIIKQMSEEIQHNMFFVNLGFDHLMKKQSLNADLLSKHLLTSLFFPEEHHQIIKNGIDRFFEKDYISSISILVPQIETAIRTLIIKIGGEIYQSPSNYKEKSFTLRSLGTLLRDDKFINFFKQFDHKVLKNIPIYFQVLLTDPRGMNLRNCICHGQFPSDYFHKSNAISVIHTLLILSLFQKNKKHRIKI